MAVNGSAMDGLQLVIPSRSVPDDDPTGWKAAERLIGFIQHAPAEWLSTTTSTSAAARASDLRRRRILPRARLHVAGLSAQYDVDARQDQLDFSR